MLDLKVVVLMLKLTIHQQLMKWTNMERERERPRAGIVK